MTMDCCFHNAPPEGCNQGRSCPVRLTERDLDRSISLSQMPGSVEANVLRNGVPCKTASGLVIGGAYTPQRSPAYADPISYHRRKSAAQRFFDRLYRWLCA